MGVIKNVKAVYDSWPKAARQRALKVRSLIRKTADQIRKDRSIESPMEETLKWGQPVYLLSSGSTLRLGYSESKPDVLSIYFNCNTKLVSTFRALFGDDLMLEGNRELQIPIEGEWPEGVVRECLRKTLEYHKLKDLPLLGG